MRKLAGPILIMGAAPGLALAATLSGVVLRGQLDGAVSLVRGADGRTTRQLVSDVGSASFIVIEARERMTAGASARVVLDAGLQVDTGRGRANNDPGTPALGQTSFGFNRRAVVGLDGDWGEVLLGRDYHPMMWATFAADPAGVRFWGNLIGVTQLQSARFNNGVFITSPPFSGWRVRAAAGLGNEAPSGAARGDGRSLGLSWRRGDWAVDAAWLAEATGTGPAFALPAADSRIVSRLVSMTWTTGASRLALGGSRLHGSGATQGYRRDALWLGGHFTLRPRWRLHGLVALTDSHPGRATTFGLALEQSLSLRSAVYLSCGAVRNDVDSNVPLTAAVPQIGATGPAAAGDLLRGRSLAACSLGMRHAF